MSDDRCGAQGLLVSSLPMPTQQRELEAGIAALEAQRALLGDAVVDMAIDGLRAKPS